MKYRTCKNCGAEAAASDAVCPKCGAALSGLPVHATPYSEYTASRLTPEGKEFYERAFAGDADAMCEVGCMFRGANEGIEGDLWYAYEWFLCAAESGCADGYYWAGFMQDNGEAMWTEDGGSIKEAVSLYKKGAKMGSARCMSRLGRIYLAGHGAKQDDARAFKYLHGAAAAGDKEAMTTSAECYLYGLHGFPQDIERAKTLYLKAGAPHLLYRELREAYETGKGVPQDRAKAKEMGEKYLEALKELFAADPQPGTPCGYAWQLGEEYAARGELETAVEWYRRAMESGDVMGRIELQHLRRL